LPYGLRFVLTIKRNPIRIHRTYVAMWLFMRAKIVVSVKLRIFQRDVFSAPYTVQHLLIWTKVWKNWKNSKLNT